MSRLFEMMVAHKKYVKLILKQKEQQKEQGQQKEQQKEQQKPCPTYDINLELEKEIARIEEKIVKLMDNDTELITDIKIVPELPKWLENDLSGYTDYFKLVVKTLRDNKLFEGFGIEVISCHSSSYSPWCISIRW